MVAFVFLYPNQRCILTPMIKKNTNKKNKLIMILHTSNNCLQYIKISEQKSSSYCLDYFTFFLVPQGKRKKLSFFYVEGYIAIMATDTYTFLIHIRYLRDTCYVILFTYIQDVSKTSQKSIQD